MDIDCYKLLGIPSNADEKAIRKAWRLKTKEVHPDINPSKDAKQKFQRLTNAQNLLLNPTTRLKHDRQFGYYEKPKNQESNTKQNFSEFQKEKAKRTVEEWSKDYNMAMQMREKQRKQTISKHKKNLLFVLFGMFVVITLIILWFTFVGSD